jgi:hypothetical protein
MSEVTHSLSPKRARGSMAKVANAATPMTATNAVNLRDGDALAMILSPSTIEGRHNIHVVALYWSNRCASRIGNEICPAGVLFRDTKIRDPGVSDIQEAVCHRFWREVGFSYTHVAIRATAAACSSATV